MLTLNNITTNLIIKEDFMFQENSNLVKDQYGTLISEGMYVIQFNTNLKRQGFVKEITTKNDL